MIDLELGARLHGRRLGGDHGLTITDALAGFAAEPGAVGWTYGLRRADWVVVDADRVLVTSEPGASATRRLGMDEVFELHLTDGGRHLRWRHQEGGRGVAVAMSEAESALAVLDGEALADEQPPRCRLTRKAVRILAGEASGDDAPSPWVTVGSARLGSYRVPLGCAVDWGMSPAVRFAEYAVRDGHGNVDVVDTVFLGFTTVRAGQTSDEEGTR